MTGMIWPSQSRTVNGIFDQLTPMALKMFSSEHQTDSNLLEVSKIACAILQISNAYKPSCKKSSVWCAGNIQTLSSSTLLVPIISDVPAGNRITDFQCEHIEADTIIFFIYSQIRKSGVQTTVVIAAEDTDVLVLAAYVANTVDGILTIKRNRIS